MTALSKATLKNIWKARFQPQASDFGNLIDSWTDYDATLTAIAVAASAGTTGVPLVTAPGAVTFVNASAAAIAGIPIFSGSQTTAIAAAPLNSQLFYAFTSSAGQGIYMQVVGGALSSSTFNNFSMRTFRGSAAIVFSNKMNFEWYGGTPSAPSAAPSGSKPVTILFNAYGDAGTVAGAAIDAITTTLASAGGVGMDIRFFADIDAGAVLNQHTTARQFRIRPGRVNFEPKAAAPASPSAGDVYYDSPTNKLKCWNGTSWNDLF